MSYRKWVSKFYLQKCFIPIEESKNIAETGAPKLEVFVSMKKGGMNVSCQAFPQSLEKSAWHQ